MKVTFLGTGTSQGVPVIACNCEVCKSLDYRDKRLRASIHIENQDLSLVIDTGPDFRQQMLREGVQRLDAVLFTHEHKDHTAGLDDIRSFNHKQQMDMPLYARPNVINQLKQEYEYIFKNPNYQGIPRVILHELHDEDFTIGNVKITPIEVMHYKLPILGYRIGDFTYITDAKTVTPAETDKIRGSKILVINALQKEDHISHFTLNEALEFIKEINPQKAYLTHLSHTMGKHQDVEKLLPNNVAIAYDGLKITV